MDFDANQLDRKLKPLRLIVWVMIFLDLIVFLSIKDSIPKIIFGGIISIFLIMNSFMSKKDNSNKLLESVGIGIISGLLVSLFRDASQRLFTPQTISMYIIGFIVGVIFILKGIGGIEDNIP